MNPYDLMGIAAGLGLTWTAALGIALFRNERITVDDYGHRTMHLVDFGGLAVAGVAVCLMMVCAAVWYGLTVN